MVFHPSCPLDSYRAYIRACNERRFSCLPDFVADDVRGTDGSGIDAWVRGLQEVVQAFPDFRWEVQEILVAGEKLAVRLHDSGTHHGAYRDIEATGRRIEVQELVIYRLEEGRIAECWGDLDAVLRTAIRPG